MADLRFYFGTMGSGKSTQALQIFHNLTARGLSAVLCTQLDREVGRVSSRLGVSKEAEIIDPGVNLHRLASDFQHNYGRLDAMVCDEAQFYEPTQIEQLGKVVDDLGVEVYAFGLLTSFQGELFQGTKRLLELADIRSEIQVEARCWCGRPATHNARLVNGVQVYDGALKVVGDTAGGQADLDGDAAPEVSYDLLCRRHWHQGLDDRRGDQLELLADGRDHEPAAWLPSS